MIAIHKFIEFSKRFLKDEEVNVILDLGSRDGVESLGIAHSYPDAKIYAFECNPYTLKDCHDNTLGNLNIEVVEKAVLDFTGKTKFHIVGPDNSDYNPGASSVFEFGNEKESQNYTTTETEVDCVRLDDWLQNNSVPKVDLVWMDLQGAELLAMEGLGSYLDEVKVIQTEVELRKYYKKQPLMGDVEKWFVNKGFTKAYVRPYSHESLDTDIIFINNKIFKQ